MDYMKKYQYNELLHYLEIDPNFLSDGLMYAESIKCDSIRIIGLNSMDIISKNINFYPLLNKLFVKRLIIEDIKIDKVQASSIESIYTLDNLKLLSLKGNKMKIDLSKLSQIEVFYCKYSKAIQNIDSLLNLKDLFIISFNNWDLKLLQRLSELKILRLTGGDFQSLEGIGTMNKLERLDICYNPKLMFPNEINKLSSIKKLHIEKCKKMTDFSFLENNMVIEELFVDKIESLNFIPSMKKLKSINFQDCTDGNLTPLLESSSLEQINFFPNKKHYTHALDEIISITGARRGIRQ